MARKLKIAFVSFTAIFLLAVLFISYKISRLFTRRKESRIDKDNRYYRQSNPNWKDKKPPPRRPYREHEDYVSKEHMRKWRKGSSYVPHPEDSEIFAAVWTIRLILVICLIIGLPILIIDFSATVKGFGILSMAYIAVDLFARKFNFHKLD